MSPETPNQPIIESVPGAEPFTGQLPDRRIVRIPEDQVTPQMRANAMFSPDNVHPGAFKPEAITVPAVAEQSAEIIGAAVAGSVVEVDEASIDSTAVRPSIEPVKPPHWDNRNIVPRIYK
jgi:hypothetical protein